MTKAILSAIPIFTMACYEAPRKIEEGLEKILKRFLWEGSKEERKIPLIGWGTACKPKFKGGAGLRRVGLQNTTLGANLISKVYRNPKRLWCRIIQNKYLDNGSPSRILTIENLQGGSAI